MIKLLFLLVLPFTTIANLHNDEDLNSFKSAVSDSVINNYEWYETPTYKKGVIDPNNTESFATFDLAKVTMKKVLLNEELTYKTSEETYAHCFEDVYTRDHGFSSIFNGVNKYATNFIPSMNWTTLDPGLDKMQKINIPNVNEYNYIEGSKYQVWILAEYAKSVSMIAKNVYVFVFKDITHDTLNDKFDDQINAFIDKQAENLISKKSLFDNETSINKPAPKFADSTYAPSVNPVFSNLNKVLSKTSDEITTNDENYYNHAYFNKNTGLQTFNYVSKDKPEHSVIEANELFSLTSRIEDGNRYYKHYICEESDADKEIIDWKENIVVESEKFPLFNNILKNLIDGSLKEYTIDISSDDFKDYKSGDIKIRFKTNDKSWTKVKVEHADHPTIKDESVLTSTCNWNLNENAMINSNQFDFASYSLPLLNGKYTFHTINSLGQYNIFTFSIINAPKEPSRFLFLSKKQIDTWNFDLKDMDNAYIDVDVTIKEEGADISKITYKDKQGDIDITPSDIVEDSKVVAKRFRVKVKDTYRSSQMVSFVIIYEDWHIETKCSYYLCSKIPFDDSIIKSISFTSTGGKANYDEASKTVSATNDVSFKVPAKEEKVVVIDDKSITYTSNYIVKVNNEIKEYKSDELVKLNAGDYSIKLIKKTSADDTNEESIEESAFTIKVKGTGFNNGLPAWAIVVIIIVPIVVVAAIIFIFIKVRKGQSLKHKK